MSKDDYEDLIISMKFEMVMAILGEIDSLIKIRDLERNLKTIDRIHKIGDPDIFGETLFSKTTSELIKMMTKICYELSDYFD